MAKSSNITRTKNNLYRVGANWYVCIIANGERYRKSCGTDRKTAELVLAEIKQKRAVARVTGDWSGIEELFKKKPKITFAEAASNYLAERPHLKPSTIAKYKENLTGYLDKQFGKQEVSKISEEQISQFQAELSKRLSARSANSVMQIFRSILKVCVRRKYLMDNPADAVLRLEQEATNIDPLSKEELDRALSFIDPYYKGLFVCLAWTGARPNELMALRWSDIDFVRKEIHINKGRVRGKEGKPKTKSATRHIPILPPVQEALDSLKARPLQSVSEYVFLSKKGQPINKHLDRIWAKALKRAGIRHRPSYQLRHTFASVCLAEGVSPGWVAATLGHSNLQTTFRHYARHIKDTSKENELRLHAMFNRSSVA